MAAGRRFVTAAALVFVCVIAIPAAQASPGNARLTNDDPASGGYVSDYTLVTGNPYTDDVLAACSQSRGRQNEPAVAVDPRNPQVIVGSSNDYCGVFQADGTVLGLGDVWLGYYRSENGGARGVRTPSPPAAREGTAAARARARALPASCPPR